MIRMRQNEKKLKMETLIYWKNNKNNKYKIITNLVQASYL